MTVPKVSKTKKTTKRGLGRGLSSLLGDSGIAHSAGIDERQTKDLSNSIKEVPIEWINVGPWQPRRRFEKDDLDELAISIKARGIFQPVLLRPDPVYNSRYQIVAGERRWRAAQLAKIHQVPSIIRDLNEEECFQIALIENVQRKDLNVIEEALGYQNLINRHDYKQEQLAVIIGKSRSHIANLLRLLFLPKSVQNLILDSKLTMGQSRPLIGNDNAENLAKIIVAKGLSAREVEKLVKERTKKGSGGSNIKSKSPDIKALETELSRKLGLSVGIDWSISKERGKMFIKFNSLEQISNFVKKLDS